MPYGVIYKAINLVNGKMYIGQTVQKLEHRKWKHYSEAKNSSLIFHRAIMKYGKDNFKWVIVDEANSKEELSEKEVYWIKRFNTYSNGYNMTLVEKV